LSWMSHKSYTSYRTYGTNRDPRNSALIETEPDA
jgi:hypothetical protein